MIQRHCFCSIGFKMANYVVHVYMWLQELCVFYVSSELYTQFEVIGVIFST